MRVDAANGLVFAVQILLKIGVDAANNISANLKNKCDYSR